MQTSDGVQEWSTTYDGKLADVFNLQESCARDIANHLNVVLGESGQQRLVDKTTDNADAYALFIEAQTLVNARRAITFRAPSPSWKRSPRMTQIRARLVEARGGARRPAAVCQRRLG